MSTSKDEIIAKYFPEFQKIYDNPQSTARQIRAYVDIIYGYIMFYETECSPTDAMEIKIGLLNAASDIIKKRFPDKQLYADEGLVQLSGDPEQAASFYQTQVNDESQQIWIINHLDAPRILASVKSRNSELNKSSKKNKFSKGGAYKGYITINRLM